MLTCCHLDTIIAVTTVIMADPAADAASSYPSAEEAFAMAFGASAAADSSTAAPAPAAAAEPSFPLYQPYQPQSFGGRTCDQCGLPGHIASKCPETMVCRKCGGPGHEQRSQCSHSRMHW